MFISLAAPVAKSVPLSPNETRRIVEILSNQAANAPAGPEKYFRDLVWRTNWPERFKSQRSGGWSGDTGNDARSLINYAIGKKDHPDVKAYTILGSLLEHMTADVGGAESDELVDLIRKYGLITDPAVVNGLRRKPGD